MTHDEVRVEITVDAPIETAFKVFTEGIDLEWHAQSDQTKASRVDVTFEARADDRTAVTLVPSGFERHGPGWEAMRDSVRGDGGWPELVSAYAKATATASGSA